LRKCWSRPTVLWSLAVLAGHILYWLARNGGGKPIEEAHTVGLIGVEPVQHMGVAAVVERISCQHSVIVPPMMPSS